MNDAMDFSPPVERSFLGLRPQDFLATLGGLLGSLPVGRAGSKFHPFQALFPLAQGFERKDQDTRLRYTVDQLKQQYGNDDSPEAKAGMSLVNAGDVRGGLAMILKGVTERNALAREERKRGWDTAAENLAGTALAPVSEPGIKSLTRMPENYQALAPGTGGALLEPGVADLLQTRDLQARQGFEPVDRAPTNAEMIARVAAEKDPEVRGSAYGKLRPLMTDRAKADDALRPKSEFHYGGVYRTDPRRGTSQFQGRPPLTEQDRALIDQRTARRAELEALTAKHKRPPVPYLGSKERPHVRLVPGQVDANGNRQWVEVRSSSTPNPDAPGGVQRDTQTRPTGVMAPFRPPAPRTAVGPTESQTTVQGTTQEKPVGSDSTTFAGMNAQMSGILQSIAPGLTLPEDPTERQGVVGLLEKDVKDAYRKQGFDVTLR